MLGETNQSGDLEGGGGGQKTESYELAMFFMARHTAADCFEKRGRRGYLFIIGDEMPYPAVKPREVDAWIGDALPQPVGLRNLVAQLTRRWDTYFILPEGAAYAGDGQVLGTWRSLLGQNVIELADLDAVCETIALTVGLGEETIDLDEGLADLADAGSASGPAVRRALAAIGAFRDGTGHQAPPSPWPARRARTARPARRPRQRLQPGLSRWQRAAVKGHVIVVDLGYGDAGKGTIVDWLCAQSARDARDAADDRGRPVQAVVRFNGGAQAAHHVLGPGGETHAFAQFGSGTFSPGTRTFLSRFMLVDLFALVAEAERLTSFGITDPFGLLAIDPARCSPPPTTAPPTARGKKRAARAGTARAAWASARRRGTRSISRRTPRGSVTSRAPAPWSPSSPGCVTGSPTSCRAPLPSRRPDTSRPSTTPSPAG